MQPNDSSLDSKNSSPKSNGFVLPAHPFVMVLAAVSVVALTALVMYSLSYDQKISEQPVRPDQGQLPVTEQPIPSVENPLEPLVYNNERMTLKVNWAEPELIQNGFAVTGFGRNAAFVPPSDFISYGAGYYDGRYYKVGAVVEGNTMIVAGSPVYVVMLQCSGLCFGPSLYRVVVSNNVPYLLGKYSSVYDDSTLEYEQISRAIVLSETEILDFPAPEKIVVPEKGTLEFLGMASGMFDVKRFTTFVDVPGVGKVYYGEIPNGQYIQNVSNDDRTYVGYYGSVNAFALEMPDGTFAYYGLAIPFMNKKTSVPSITWNDGQKNAVAFSSTTLGGCGALDTVSIVGSDVVNPAKDLVEIGVGSKGEKIYFLKNTEHELLKSKYEGYGTYDSVTGKLERVPYEEFLAAHPMFFWVDPFGRLMHFHNMTFAPLAECGKPVIYLYPEQQTEVSVKVRLQNGMTVSDPEYNDGWNVVARPDGSMVNKADGATYPYLFWEGRGMYYETPEAGWMVQREGVPGFLKDKLGMMGLNETEIRDFMEFWVPLMQEKPWYFVTFAGTESMNSIAPLTISPKPDTVFRVLMDYEPLDAPREVREPQRLPRVIRRGFTVVEWGGVLGR